MNNVITITLQDKEGIHKIEFDSSPTITELVAINLIITECLEHNFHRGEILEAEYHIYNRLSNVEEVIRGREE